MSDFGDYTEDDAYDPAPPDPEQVARKLHEVRLDAGLERSEWTELAADEQSLRVEVVFAVLGWLRRQGGIR